MTHSFLFILVGTEHESGWGQRPDGFMILRTEATADAWLKDYAASQTGPTPHEYTTWDKIGYLPVTAEVAAELEASERPAIWKRRRSDFIAVID
ncbi:hypothetical protein HOU02_gp432 [Caulobacter phage CcrBL9]|uniref:Uncharacterized protein n=1 Tax=Caulobacter phage CcrBL9 TaxID=2283270 RepID=A0A385EBY4_9CAUD|nr:hypothetical protein HOU02_gp432 [Caulobacter phage CcrBL9]AXQ69293.1 hypothetical protein CcrBL9_gp269c [Caulobacter phage CcrBL9]